MHTVDTGPTLEVGGSASTFQADSGSFPERNIQGHVSPPWVFSRSDVTSFSAAQVVCLGGTHHGPPGLLLTCPSCLDVRHTPPSRPLILTPCPPPSEFCVDQGGRRSGVLPSLFSWTSSRNGAPQRPSASPRPGRDSLGFPVVSSKEPTLLKQRALQPLGHGAHTSSRLRAVN